MDAGPVGRARERAELDRALASSGTSVLVTGEAGIGKSTLLAGLTARSAASGVPVLLGRCVPDHGVPGFWTWTRMLASPAAVELGLDPSLVEVDAADAPATARFRAVARCADRLVGAADAGGLVVAVEDVHWADEATLALLTHLARDTSGTRLLLVATARDPLPEPLAGLAGTTGLRLALGPLDVADVRAWVGDDAVRLHRRSGGNPLYLRELVRQGSDGEIGAGLRDLLLRRLDELAPHVRALLDGAAVLGDEVDTDVLAPDTVALAGARAAGVLVEDPREPRRLRWAHALLRSACYDALDREVRIGWHRRVADAGGPPGRVAEHRLRSADGPEERARAVEACRAAARDATGRRAAGEASRWCRAALDVADDDAVRADLYVALAEAAFDDDQVDDALTACRHAADLGERIGCADVLARAAVVVRGIGTEILGVPVRALCDRARAALGDEDSARHARVLAQAALALVAAGRLDEAAEESSRALEMAGRHDPDGAGLDAVLHALHARHDAVAGPDHLTEQLALARRMTALGRAGGRPEAEMWGLVWRIDTDLVLGALDDLDAATDELAALVDRLGTSRGRWHLLRTRAARAFQTGHFDEALRLADEYLELSRTTQDVSAQGLYDAFVSIVHEERGTLGGWAPQPLSLEFARGLPVYLAAAGRTFHARGDVDFAHTFFDELRPRLAGLVRDAAYPVVLVEGADLALRCGDLETARWCAEQVRPLAALRCDGAPGCRGVIGRHVGAVATALGEFDDAVRLTGDAVVLERKAGALPLLARAQLVHGRALLGRGGTGDRERARTAVAEAASLGRRLGMAPLTRECAELTAELGGARTGPATLTARERETVALVATGLANRDVAARLVVSERTVESHVRNALGKLGLTNRTQLAAWAAQTGLGG